MTKAPRSGIVVKSWHLPLIFGMLKRGDRQHDIAAWFGLNPGRIKDAMNKRYGVAPPAPVHDLPPSGSPGPRALELRQTLDKLYKLLKSGDVQVAMEMIDKARVGFDKNQ